MTSDKTRSPVRVGLYDVERTIGKGNFAVVKSGRHRVTNTEVAVKIVDKTRLDASNLRKVHREVQILKMLNHPHVIKLYQVMETKNMLYFVMEFAPKGEIFEYIATRGRLSETEARTKFWQIVRAIEYCHDLGIVHRDLKAENLLLDALGNIKIADFGFSNFYRSDGALRTFCGSPPYAAPEVFEGKQYIGPEVDIWSLGVVLYVFVCGALPFDGATLPALKERVLRGRFRIPYFMSSDCENLIRRMLVVDASRRCTLTQLKAHRWMRAAIPADGDGAASTVYDDAARADAEPCEQVLKLMHSMGIDSQKTLESLKKGNFDNYAAIYMLLYDRWRVQSINPTTIDSRRRRSAAETPSSPHNRPRLDAIRMQSTFSQTTDCSLPSACRIGTLMQPSTSIGSTSSASSGADSGIESYGFSESASLSRQSTTTSSLDEGLDADFGLATGIGGVSTAESSRGGAIGELLGGSDALLGGAMLDSMDSQVECDLMSSLSSSGRPDAPSSSFGAQSLRSALPASMDVHDCCQQQATSDFRESRHASADHVEFETPCSRRHIAADRPVYSFNKPLGSMRKTRGVTELRVPVALLRPHAVGADALHPLAIAGRDENFDAWPSQHAPAGAPVGTEMRRVGRQRPPLPKRISLPEHLELQPHRLLAIKQSMYVEQQLERSGDELYAGSTADEPGIASPSSAGDHIKSDSWTPLSQVICPKLSSLLHQQTRLHQKRQIFQKQTARRSMLRQPSYQLAQKYPVTPDTNTCVSDLEMCRISAPLSPIDDLSGTQERDEEEPSTRNGVYSFLCSSTPQQTNNSAQIT